MLEMIGIFVVGALLLLVVGVAFYFGKKDSKLFNKSVFDADKRISKKFLEIVNQGVEVDKDFVVGIDKKGEVLKKKKVESDLSKVEDFDVKGFFDGKKEYKDFVEDFDGNNLMLKVKRGSKSSGGFLKGLFKKSSDEGFEVFILPEKFINESVDAIVVSEDLTFYPFDKKVWLPNRLSSMSIYQSVNFMDMFNAQIKMFRNSMDDLNHFERKHSKKIEELEAMKNSFQSGGYAGDINKYSNN